MDIFNIMFSFVVILGCAMTGTLLSLFPALTIGGMPKVKRYYITTTPMRSHKRVEQVMEGYEHANQREAMIARFNPFQHATAEEVEMWDGIQEEEAKAAMVMNMIYEVPTSAPLPPFPLLVVADPPIIEIISEMKEMMGEEYGSVPVMDIPKKVWEKKPPTNTVSIDALGNVIRRRPRVINAMYAR